MCSVAAVADEYPVLRLRCDKGRIIAVNSAASAQIPVTVMARVVQASLLGYDNVHRGLSTLSRKASKGYERAHSTAESLINAPEGSVFFVPNATYGINTVLCAVAEHQKLAGIKNHICCTEADHNSTVLPARKIAKEYGRKPEIIRVQKSCGNLSAKDVVDGLGDAAEEVGVLTTTHASNVTGAVNDVKGIGAALRQVNECLFHLVDGAQTTPRMPVDVQDLGCDAFVCAGHKIAGNACSFVYLKPEWMRKLTPPFTGGGTVSEVTEEDSKPAKGYLRWEPGTQNILGAVALDSAIRFRFLAGLTHLEPDIEGLKTRAGGFGVCGSEKEMREYLFGDAEPPAQKMVRFWDVISSGSEVEEEFEIAYGQDLPRPLIVRAMENIRSHEQGLHRRFVEEVAGVEGYRILGSPFGGAHVGVVSLIPEKGTVEDLSRELDRRGIQTRSGCHCAQLFMKRMLSPNSEGHTGTVRFSFDIYNSQEDVADIVTALCEISGSLNG